jgi:hypothetical protein
MSFFRSITAQCGAAPPHPRYSREMRPVEDKDADSIVLRLLCETAQERLERTWAAAEFSHRTVQLPDGTYVWAKETDPPAQMTYSR